MSLFIVDTQGNADLLNVRECGPSTSGLSKVPRLKEKYFEEEELFNVRECEPSTSGLSKVPSLKEKYFEDEDLFNVRDCEPSTSGLSKVPSLKEKCFEEETDESEQSEHEDDLNDMPPPKKDISAVINQALSGELNAKNDDNADSMPEAMKWLLNLSSMKIDFQYDPKIEKEMKSSVLRGAEDKKELPTPSFKALKKLKKEEREKTKGKHWFDLPATEVTEEVETDLKILQMRSALDSKTFYKNNDMKTLPKYFQIGTVQHSPLDYHSEKHIRKNKRKTIADELIADPNLQLYQKKKYKEVMEANQRTSYKMRKMKEKKKKKIK